MQYLARLLLISVLVTNQFAYSVKQNIALCTVATGKYACYVKEFVESARKNFLPEHHVKYFIFTDQALPVEEEDIVVVRWPHKKWPFSTMMRFKAYHENADLFDSMDYVFAYDVDAIFVDHVGNEILGPSMGVLHPGYYKKDLLNTGIINILMEKNQRSAVYLQPKRIYKQYFAGGFYGGETAWFKKTVAECYKTIIQDLKSGIIAKWHDETHLNYYFLHNPPKIKLSPSYCYPEEAKSDPKYKHLGTKKPIIKVLDKKHTQMRSEERCLDDREFVVLIPSYNNIKYYQANLDSVYNQTYKKYRIVYIDDNSPDGTGEAVCQYIRALNKENITTVIKNQDRKLAMANIYNGIHNYCMDHEIVLMLDGDDQLSDPYVLSRLNDEYKKSDIWFTYGNCWFDTTKRTCPWSKAIEDKEIELNRFREWDGAATHLRTFYAWLFKKVKQSDLMLHGDFFKMTYDVAMFMPMLEMAGYHHKFIKDVLYLYNYENPLNDHKINSRLQLDLNKHIRKNLPKYSPITKLEYFDKILKDSLDINDVCIIEIAAILNDFISEIFNIYNKTEATLILNKILFLQHDFVVKSDLISIASSRSYTYLQQLLAKSTF